MVALRAYQAFRDMAESVEIGETLDWLFARQQRQISFQEALDGISITTTDISE
jgi:hypothetical protein